MAKLLICVNHQIVFVEIIVAGKKAERFLIERLKLRLPVMGSGVARPDDHPVAAAVRSFLNGEEDALSSLEPDLRSVTPFGRAVLQATRMIPWGQTVSYAQLAAQAGYPRAVRAVATVMRKNDFPLIFPCHRVIYANGTLGGFMGHTFGSAVLIKKRLIENEASQPRTLALKKGE